MNFQKWNRPTMPSSSIDYIDWVRYQSAAKSVIRTLKLRLKMQRFLAAWAWFTAAVFAGQYVWLLTTKGVSGFSLWVNVISVVVCLYMTFHVWTHYKPDVTVLESMLHDMERQAYKREGSDD